MLRFFFYALLYFCLPPFSRLRVFLFFFSCLVLSLLSFLSFSKSYHPCRLRPYYRYRSRYHRLSVYFYQYHASCPPPPPPPSYLAHFSCHATPPTCHPTPPLLAIHGTPHHDARSIRTRPTLVLVHIVYCPPTPTQPL